MINYYNVISVIKDYLVKNNIHDFDNISDEILISTFKYYLYLYGNEFVQNESNIKKILNNIKKEEYTI